MSTSTRWPRCAAWAASPSSPAVPDVNQPVVAELRPVRVAADVGDVEHPGFVAAPVPYLGDLFACVVEEVLQFIEGERALLLPGLDLLQVRRCVPVVHHLDRMGTEALLADRRPVVGRVADVLAERAQRVLIGPQRRVRAAAHRPQVAEPLVGMLRCPLPREHAGVLEERPQPARPLLDRGQGQVARQLLVAPAVQQRLEPIPRTPPPRTAPLSPRPRP